MADSIENFNDTVDCFIDAILATPDESERQTLIDQIGSLWGPELSQVIQEMVLFKIREMNISKVQQSNISQSKKMEEIKNIRKEMQAKISSLHNSQDSDKKSDAFESDDLGAVLEEIDFSAPKSPPLENPFVRNPLVPSSKSISNLLGKTQSSSQQDALSLLYLIAEDCSKMVDAIHHGVSCNYCGMSPITGPRYHCSNCADVDLCEACELANRHTSYHYKIKIKVPIPLMKSPRWRWKSSIPVGAIVRGFDVPESLPAATLLKLGCELKEFPGYLEKLYDLFKTIVDYRTQTDDGEFIYGITKRTIIEVALRNLANDVLGTAYFRFYDEDKDGIVTFTEFVTTYHAILLGSDVLVFKKVLQAFDKDNDGYFDQNDVYEILNGFIDYLSKIAPLPDGSLISRHLNKRIWEGRRPLSSLFPSVMEEPERPLTSAFMHFQNTASNFGSSKSVIINYVSIYESLLINENVPREWAEKYGLLNYALVDELKTKHLKSVVDSLFHDLGWPEKVKWKEFRNRDIDIMLKSEYFPLLVSWVKIISFF